MTTKPVGGATRCKECAGAGSVGQADEGTLAECPQCKGSGAAGPVGGAGELTARILALKDDVNLKFGRGIQVAKGITLGDLFDAFVALAAKAPQGVFACPVCGKPSIHQHDDHELLYWLEAQATRFGKSLRRLCERYYRLTQESEAAAKAPQGVPACEYCEALWERDEKTMKHRHPSVAGFGAFAYKCTAAPPAPSLPVPGPVSDTTIHHGMFPPAASVVAADDMSYTEKLARELALRVLGHSPIPISSYDSEQKAKEIVELLTYEAAAPKPAPAPTGKAHDPGCRPHDRFSTLQCPGCWVDDATDAQGAMAEVVEDVSTPAPGAERPAPTWDNLPERDRFEKWWRDATLDDVGEILDEFDLDQQALIAGFAKRVWREALAAAPPVPAKLQQQAIDAQRTGVAPGCFSGGKEQIGESTVRNHELEGPALWHEAERIDAITPRYERMEVIATLVKHSRDRHASAERVREEIANELSSPYKESIFTPLSDDELMRCVDVLTNSGVRAASDRLHASWARHWSKVLRSRALPPSTREKS